MRHLFGQLLLSVGIGAVAMNAAAQAGMPTHADKPVTLVVSFPPGGAPDQIARLLAPQLQARWKTPIIVVNRAGASGNLGNDSVARAEPDGHTLLVTPNTFTMVPHVLPAGSQQHADVVKDYTPIALLSSASMLMLASPKLGAKTAGDVARMAKAQPDLGYATSGNGSPMHIVGELFNKVAGTKLAHVPYKGVAPAVNDLIGGHVPTTFMTYGPLAPYVGGKVNVLAVADNKRTSLAPSVPTLAELGYKDVEVSAWQGLFGPKGLSPEIVKLLNTHMNDILKMPDVVSKMHTFGALPAGGDPAHLGQVNANDYNRFSKLIKDLGIQAD